MTTVYKVNDLYPCIQGEGVHAGTPMVMIRLQGCPVGCHFCDTKETWDALPEQEYPLDQALGVSPRWSSMTAAQIVNVVAAIGARPTPEGSQPGIRWALVSGGEPLLQDLDELTVLLDEAKFRTALETSGTEPITGAWDWITVSPKVGNPGGRSIIPETIRSADEVKWVVGKAADLAALDAFLAEHRPAAEIALQPLSQSEAATKLCVDRCMERGWRLSIQLHKYIFPDWKGRSV